MKKQDKLIFGWMMIFASVILFISAAVGNNRADNNITVKTLIGAVLIIWGICLAVDNRTGKEYWKNIKPGRLEKVKARVGKEKDYATAEKIASSAAENEIREIARSRMYELLSEALEKKQNPDDIKKTVSIILRDGENDEKIRSLLKEAAEKHPEQTREIVDAEVINSVKYNIVARRIQFLTDAAKLYPDIIRSNYAKLESSLHSDSNSHDDKAAGFHTDDTQYYDYIRYPDGRTVANKSGRRKHTDTRSSYSDCHNDSHTDKNTHTDRADYRVLSPLKPYISEE